MPDAFEVSPVVHSDDRGAFLEYFRADLLGEATGRRFDLHQGNISVSRRGVARGIHYAGLPNGQAKYITVLSGSVVDYVVDIRVDSPTFATWTSIELDDQNRKGVFIPEGLGHLFVATSEWATVSYLTNEYYNPSNERAISPLDAELGLTLPMPASELVLSAQDAAAPSLREALDAGQLPTWEASLATYRAAAA